VDTVDSKVVHVLTLHFGNKERRVAYEIQIEEERRTELGFNENNLWSIEKEAKLKEEEEQRRIEEIRRKATERERRRLEEGSDSDSDDYWYQYR